MADTPTASTNPDQDRKIANDPLAPPAMRTAARMRLAVDELQYKDPMSDPAYAAGMKQLEEWSKGTLTAEDRAREYEALGEAQNFAAGESGAIAQDAAARGGGGAGVNSVRQQLSAQGAAKRLGSADVAVAGQASQRAVAARQEFDRQMSMNSQMQNSFAMQKAGLTQDTLKYMEALQQAQAEQQQQFVSGAIKDVAGFALGVPGLKTPASMPALPQTTHQPGYTSSGNIGIPLPGASFSSTLQGPTGTTDFGSGPMTADAAARAYAESLPFAHMATPGSAPSTTSHAAFDMPEDALWPPRKTGGF